MEIFFHFKLDRLLLNQIAAKINMGSVLEIKCNSLFAGVIN